MSWHTLALAPRDGAGCEYNSAKAHLAPPPSGNYGQ